MPAAPERMALAFQLALWTGQRQGDLLRLTWSAYDGKVIRLRQSKNGLRVTIPVAETLRTVLDATPKKAVTILTNSKSRPWTAGGFRTTWGKTVSKAGVSGATFHDLRGTAVIRFALSGATNAEIATITGHSLRQVTEILDAHYLHRDSRLAENTMNRRELHEGRTKLPN